MDHEDLIVRLRARAWDPALRPSVWIPLADLARTTDPALADLRRRHQVEDPDPWHAERIARNERVHVRGGSPEALAYCRNMPHSPAFPPLSMEEIAAVEARLGTPLPALLRRVYTEIGDGGFGPGWGLAGLGPDADPDEHPVTWWELEENEPPDSDHVRLGLYLCDYGCAIRDWVSLSERGNPVRTWEPGEDPREVLASAGVPLVEWFEQWLAKADG